LRRIRDNGLTTYNARKPIRKCLLTGVRHIQKTNQCHLMIIDNFSDEIKDAVRARLCEICYGLQILQPGSMYTDYKLTLKEFLDRFDTKTPKQQKGIIGELLTHVLLRYYLDNLKPASILFNKEERSMRKGFDLIFLESEHAKVWYSEVKSGQPTITATSSSKSLNLLQTARADIINKFTNAPSSVWLSAVYDSNLTVAENVRPLLQRLLEADAPAKRQDDFSAAAILVSVVYASRTDEINYDDLSNYFNTVYDEELFSDLIVVSIQKETIRRVVEFLRSET